MRRDDWDQKVSAVLWAYITTCKRQTGSTPFRLFYGQEAVIPMEYIMLILQIIAVTEMKDTNAVE